MIIGPFKNVNFVCNIEQCSIGIIWHFYIKYFNPLIFEILLPKYQIEKKIHISIKMTRFPIKHLTFWHLTLNFEDFGSNTKTPKSLKMQNVLILLWKIQWLFTKLISDAPRDMTLKPRYDVYFVGREIVCHSDSNPAANFHWVDNRTGEQNFI